MNGWWIKKWRAIPDNPAGTPYFLLAMINVSDGTTNRGGPAIPSPNPGHNREGESNP